MEITEKKFLDHCIRFEELGKNLQPSLSKLLTEENISYLSVDYRIKEYESFKDKVERKGYKDPLVEIEDFCGVRVICYFPSDIEKIAEMINKEFIVHSSQDKSLNVEIDRFGYRSYHFIVSIKPEWLLVPNFRGLDGLKVEIQVRTILMHAWADIEHKLQYKKKEHIPKTIQRKFYQLSAIFELADEQFENIRDKKEEVYLASLSKSENYFDVNQDLNADTLQAFLDIYTGDRLKSHESTTDLLDELLEFDITFDYLVKLFNLYSKEEIIQMEKDWFEIKDVVYVGEDWFEVEEQDDDEWAQVGLVRNLLDINHESYSENRNHYFRDEEYSLIEKYKKV